MVYLNHIVSYVPETKRAVADFAAELGLEPQALIVYNKVYGLDKIAVSGHESLYDLLDNALAQIIPTEISERERIKYIFHCHAAPCVCPSGADLLGTLKEKHGLQHAISVGLSLEQCATPLTAMNLADLILHDEAENAQVLLLTAEVGFHAKLRHIPNTTIMGDASAACLLGKRGERNAVLTVAQRKFELADVQPPSRDAVPLPATSYGDDLIQVIKDALSGTSLNMDDISLILIHNVNTISWKFFARNFPCPPDLIYMKNVARSGHCFTSDPFINYCDAMAEGRIRIGDHFLMVSVGTSSTYAAVVVKH